MYQQDVARLLDWTGTPRSGTAIALIPQRVFLTNFSNLLLAEKLREPCQKELLVLTTCVCEREGWSREGVRGRNCVGAEGSVVGTKGSENSHSSSREDYRWVTSVPCMHVWQLLFLQGQQFPSPNTRPYFP